MPSSVVVVGILILSEFGLIFLLAGVAPFPRDWLATSKPCQAKTYHSTSPYRLGEGEPGKRFLENTIDESYSDFLGNKYRHHPFNLWLQEFADSTTHWVETRPGLKIILIWDKQIDSNRQLT